MKTRLLAIAAAAMLAVTPALYACGGSQGGTSQNGDSQSSAAQSTSQPAETEKPSAPTLDGNWRQVGHAEDDDGMIGSIDQDMIALWIKGNDKKMVYWCGSFEPPKDSNAYTWTSKADKGNMQGLFASQDDSKEFSYKDGKLTFEFTMRGDTTTVEMEQVSEESGLLAEQRAGEGKSVSKGEANVKDLVLSDSCYSVENGHALYTIAINNPNDEYAPKSVNVNVVGRKEDGSISFSDDWQVSTVLPGATTFWSHQAGRGNATESDKIEIKLSVDDDNWFKTSQKYDFYQIDNVSTSTSSTGNPVVTGEVTLKQDVELSGFSKANRPMLVCVLKDANGKMVGGYSQATTKDLKVGEATAFEIEFMGQKPVEFATAEVYANPWA